MSSAHAADIAENWKIKLLIWTGPLGIALVCLGFFAFAGFAPPPAPTLSHDQVVSLWQQQIDLKRLGLMLCIWGGVLYVSFSVAIAFFLRRSERTPYLTVTQAAFGTFGTVFFSANFLILLITSFRPEVNPSNIQLLHDAGFISTFSPVQPFTFQYLLIGLAILADKSIQPLFPRWVAYVNFWVRLLFVPAAFIPFFKTGPLAWDGLLSFWIPVAVFVLWYLVMTYAMLKALPRLHHD